MFRYIHVQDGNTLPVVSDLRPFKAIVVVEDRPSREWQTRVSRWLIDSGCLYMMAWGEDCSSWDDSVDWANLEAHDFDDTPDDQCVMTTWHDDEPLEAVFRLAKNVACHPTIELQNVLVLHIGAHDKCAMFEKLLERP